MKRVSDADLRIRIAIQLSLMPKSYRHACGVSGEAAVARATAAIMDRVLAGCVVVAPDIVPNPPWEAGPGQFGVTEPWPAGCAPEDATLREQRPARR